VVREYRFNSGQSRIQARVVKTPTPTCRGLGPDRRLGPAPTEREGPFVRGMFDVRYGSNVLQNSG
jgi:hypothetical protein